VPELTDSAPGRQPELSEKPGEITFSMPVIGGLNGGEVFRPTPKTRLVLRCSEADGEIYVRLVASREPC
jgi:hypothetical protein